MAAIRCNPEDELVSVVFVLTEAAADIPPDNPVSLVQLVVSRLGSVVSELLAVICLYV